MCVEGVRVEKVGRGDCRDRRGRGTGAGEVDDRREVVAEEGEGEVRPGTRIENSSHFVADDG